MKKIYDDNQVMSPDIMDNIARQYVKQKICLNNQLDIDIAKKMQQNLHLLEYIDTYQPKNSYLQKCLVKTYSIAKNLTHPLDTQPFLSSISLNQAKQLCFENSLNILQKLANNYKQILSVEEYKTIVACLEVLSVLKNK